MVFIITTARDTCWQDYRPSTFRRLIDYIIFFLFCSFNTVIITLKWVSKRSSFRYAFQEHLLKFLMLAVTNSE
jgi:hypothetical protein